MATLLPGSSISTPSQKFISEFERVFGISLLDGKWHDKMFSVSAGHYLFKLAHFDKYLSQKDSEYDYENATYCGEDCSMNDYLLKKFNQYGQDLVTYLTESDNFDVEMEGLQ